MSKTFLFIAGGLLATAIAGAAYVRLAPVDAERFHRDPDQITKAKTPNNYLVSAAPSADRAPVRLQMSRDDLMAAIDAWVLALPHSERRVGSIDSGLVTYVIRTQLMRYPDTLTVKVVEADEGAALSIYSKAIYGRSDFGVSQRRVEALFAELGIK